MTQLRQERESGYWRSSQTEQPGGCCISNPVEEHLAVLVRTEEVEELEERVEYTGLINPAVG